MRPAIHFTEGIYDGYQPRSPPLSPEDVSQSVGTLCVVPIGLPVEIQTELQDWYRLSGPFVVNEFGQ